MSIPRTLRPAILTTATTTIALLTLSPPLAGRLRRRPRRRKGRSRIGPATARLPAPERVSPRSSSARAGACRPPTTRTTRSMSPRGPTERCGPCAAYSQVPSFASPRDVGRRGGGVGTASESGGKVTQVRSWHGRDPRQRLVQEEHGARPRATDTRSTSTPVGIYAPTVGSRQHRKNSVQPVTRVLGSFWRTSRSRRHRVSAPVAWERRGRSPRLSERKRPRERTRRPIIRRDRTPCRSFSKRASRCGCRPRS